MRRRSRSFQADRPGLEPQRFAFPAFSSVPSCDQIAGVKYPQSQGAARLICLTIGAFPFILLDSKLETANDYQTLRYRAGHIGQGETGRNRFKRPEDSDLSFPSPVEYDLRVSKSGDNVWVQGPVRAKLSLTCDRCLEEFAYTVESELDIELLPKAVALKTPEVELQTDEMNLYYFEGEEIDLDPYVFEEVMLNLPIKALCSDACKGMCPSCGHNLNIEHCHCETSAGNTLAEKLKPFLKER